MNKATDHDGRVARDAVWTEYIGKELMTMKLRTEFTVNTDEMHLISDKPNHIVPRHENDVQKPLEGDQDVIKQVHTSLLRKQLAPREKLKHPQTTSQDLGWWKYSKGPMKPNPMFHKPRSMNEITRYAQRYIISKGKSPFAS